jgi:type I restriction enzyme, R subunit
LLFLKRLDDLQTLEENRATRQKPIERQVFPEGADPKEVALLPSELPDEDEEAKRFDLLMLHLQFTVLHVEPGFERLKEQVRSLVGMLEEKSSIPMVREQMALIEAVAGEEWWQDVTVPMLETARKRLRSLIKLIEKVHRRPVYTDFEGRCCRV